MPQKYSFLNFPGIQDNRGVYSSIYILFQGSMKMIAEDRGIKNPSNLINHRLDMRDYTMW